MCSFVFGVRLAQFGSGCNLFRILPDILLKLRKTPQMEREKEELSQELIGAKLQVAQLYMEVDGIKLRHRQAALATASALVIEDGDDVSPTSSARTSPPPSPNSPITMQL